MSLCRLIDQSALKKLNAVFLQFRTKYLTHTLWPDVTTWPSQVEVLQQIIKAHHLDHVDFPTLLTEDNV